MAGRHRGQATEPAYDGAEAPAALEDAFAREEESQEGRSPAALFAGVGGLVAVVLVVAIALLVSPDSRSGSAVTPTPTTSAAAVAQVPTTSAPAPKAEPTRGEYVPPLVTATPTHKASPIRTSASPSQSATQKPPCPIQFPMARDWCIRHGFAPPKG